MSSSAPGVNVLTRAARNAADARARHTTMRTGAARQHGCAHDGSTHRPASAYAHAQTYERIYARARAHTHAHARTHPLALTMCDGRLFRQAGASDGPVPLARDETTIARCATSPHLPRDSGSPVPAPIVGLPRCMCAGWACAGCSTTGTTCGRSRSVLTAACAHSPSDHHCCTQMPFAAAALARHPLRA